MDLVALSDFTLHIDKLMCLNAVSVRFIVIMFVICASLAAIGSPGGLTMCPFNQHMHLVTGRDCCCVLRTLVDRMHVLSLR